MDAKTEKQDKRIKDTSKQARVSRIVEREADAEIRAALEPKDTTEEDN